MNGIFDVLYCDGVDEKSGESYLSICRDLVSKSFPDAQLANTSDYIDGWCLTVEMNDVDDDTWLLFLMKNGLYNISLIWQFASLTKPNIINQLAQSVIEANKNKPIEES